MSGRLREARFSAAAVMAAALAVALAPGRAHAYYVRTPTKKGIPMPTFWKESCTGITIFPGAFEERTHVLVTALTKSVAAAAHAWSPDAVTCPVDPAHPGETHPYFEIVPTLAPLDAVPPAVGDDARNILVFRTRNWTLSGKDDGPPSDFLDPEALAYTYITTFPDGHITDADILVNAFSQRWKNFDPGVTPSNDQGDTFREFDLQAVLTHEFGHFLGFAHTCVQPGEFEVPPLDNELHQVPLCSEATDASRQSIMFVDTGAADPSKRVLFPDDKRGVCDVYPPRLDPKICAADKPYDGCAVAAPRRRGESSAAGGVVAALIGAVVVSGLRRRRRRARA